MKILITILVLFLTGCASVGFEEFKKTKADQRPVREEKAGMIVSCRVVLSPEETTFFFGFNLPDYNIIPIVVYLENTGDDNFTFYPDKLHLFFENGEKLEYISWRSVYKKIAFSYWRSLPGFPFALFPGFMIAMSVSNANEHIASNYHNKALDEITLPPGVYAQGVVFLTAENGMPINIKDIACSDLKLQFSRRTKQNTVPFNIFFHLKG